MIAIRGATTVENDTINDIKKAVKELLTEIVMQNLIKKDDIICIMFSNTADLCSYYPAKAAREAGFFSSALFSSLEPQINGSLDKCIRVMLLVESDRSPKHIYLNGAAGLRKDITEKLNIALDGPAGSGKSTVAKLIAKALDILYLDTGAMYRACALACNLNAVECNNEPEVEELLKKLDISVKYENGVQKTLLNGVDVSTDIRTPEISMQASIVSAHKCVRIKMVELQRKIASENSCILDGRDIGTNVLPNSKFKYFITASPEIRAKRRLLENKEKGYNQPYEDVLKEIKLRDKQDTTREFAPLAKADDAKEIITDNLPAEDVAQLILKDIHGKI